MLKINAKSEQLTNMVKALEFGNAEAIVCKHMQKNKRDLLLMIASDGIAMAQHILGITVLEKDEENENIEGQENESKGVYVIDSMFLELIKKAVCFSDVVTISFSDLVYIECGKASFTCGVGTNAVNMNFRPEEKNNAKPVSVKYKDLCAMINYASIYSRDDKSIAGKNEAYNGNLCIHFEQAGETKIMKAFATQGGAFFSFAHCDISTDDDSILTTRYSVKAIQMKSLLDVLSGEDVTLLFSEKNIIVQEGTSFFVLSLVENKFSERILSLENDESYLVRTEVEKNELKMAIDCIQVGRYMTYEEQTTIWVKIGENKLTLSSYDKKQVVDIDCKTEGEGMEVLVQGKKMLNAIATDSSEKVSLSVMLALGKIEGIKIGSEKTGAFLVKINDEQVKDAVKAKMAQMEEAKKKKS